MVVVLLLCILTKEVMRVSVKELVLIALLTVSENLQSVVDFIIYAMCVNKRK
jgi:hypothetical protein